MEGFYFKKRRSLMMKAHLLMLLINFCAVEVKIREKPDERIVYFNY